MRWVRGERCGVAFPDAGAGAVAYGGAALHLVQQLLRHRSEQRRRLHDGRLDVGDVGVVVGRNVFHLQHLRHWRHLRHLLPLVVVARRDLHRFMLESNRNKTNPVPLGILHFLSLIEFTDLFDYLSLFYVSYQLLLGIFIELIFQISFIH